MGRFSGTLEVGCVCFSSVWLDCLQRWVGGLCGTAKGASTPSSLGWPGQRWSELGCPSSGSTSLALGCQLLQVPAAVPSGSLPCGGGFSFGSSLKIACHHRKMSPSTSSILCRLCRYMLGTCPCMNSRAERSLTRGRVLVRQSAAVSSGEKSLFGSEASHSAGGGSGDGRQRLPGSHLLFLPASLWAGAGCPGRAHVVPFRCQPCRCRPFPALVR